jgi:Flp pilus assembly protein TadG
MILHHPKNRPDGATLIEFATILLLLLTILLGIMEAGRVVMNYHTLYEAVSEGARFASVNGSTSGPPPGPRSIAEVDPLIKQKVVDAAVGLQLSTSDVQISWTPDNRSGSTVSVSASYLYVPFALGWSSFSLNSLSNVTVLR